jgi:hypothetical protein
MLLRLWMMVPNELSCYTSTGMAPTDVMFVLLHMNMQPGRMDVGWMDAPYASLMCLNALMLTAQCIIFITTIVVMGTHKLSTIIIDQIIKRKVN